MCDGVWVGAYCTLGSSYACKEQSPVTSAELLRPRGGHGIVISEFISAHRRSSKLPVTEGSRLAVAISSWQHHMDARALRNELDEVLDALQGADDKSTGQCW